MEVEEVVNGEISLLINSELDVVNARQKGKWMAEEIGFRGSEVTLLSTLISELARKVISVDCKGNILIRSIQKGPRRGIAISVSENLKNALDLPLEQDGSRTAPERLPHDDRLLMLASRHVADEFEIKPKGRNGAVVRVVKWL